MAGIKLDKGNILEFIGLLKERYGNKKLSKIQTEITDDKEFMGITFIHKLLYGKRMKIRLRSEGIKGVFKAGKKL